MKKSITPKKYRIAATMSSITPISVYLADYFYYRQSPRTIAFVLLKISDYNIRIIASWKREALSYIFWTVARLS